MGALLSYIRRRSIAVALALAVVVSAWGSTNAHDSGAPEASNDGATQTLSLQKQADDLARQLSESKAHCETLKEENGALLAKLGSDRATLQGAPVDAVAAGAISEFILLPEPRWQTGGIADPQNLGDCLNGVALRLSAFDGTMVAQPVDPSHLNLIVQKVNGGLGEVTALPAAKMWIQSGSLMVQWIDKEISTAAIEKLKYTALEITDSDGHKVKGFCFLKPTTTSLPLDDGATTNVLVPHSIAAVCKLTIATTPSGWDLSTTDDSTVVLRHDPAIVRLEYDRKFSSVSIACTGINSVDPVHQLAALQTQLTTAQRQLEETKRQYDASPAQGTTVDGGPFGTRYYASARDGLGTEMQQEQEHIDKLQGWIDKAQKGLGTNSAVGPAPLEGVVASIVLPNGVEVARIALGSNLSK